MRVEIYNNHGVKLSIHEIIKKDDLEHLTYLTHFSPSKYNGDRVADNLFTAIQDVGMDELESYNFDELEATSENRMWRSLIRIESIIGNKVYCVISSWNVRDWVPINRDKFPNYIYVGMRFHAMVNTGIIEKSKLKISNFEFSRQNHDKGLLAKSIVSQW